MSGAREGEQMRSVKCAKCGIINQFLHGDRYRCFCGHVGTMEDDAVPAYGMIVTGGALSDDKLARSEAFVWEKLNEALEADRDRWRALALALRDALLQADPIEIDRAGIAISRAEKEG